jgi:hypothetical protein
LLPLLEQCGASTAEGSEAQRVERVLARDLVHRAGTEEIGEDITTGGEPGGARLAALVTWRPEEEFAEVVGVGD